MKIISRGTKPADKIYRGKCQNCKTVFECLAHEGKLAEDLHEGYKFLHVHCPVCNEKAIAYERDDGQPLSTHEREDKTWPDFPKPPEPTWINMY